MISVLYECALWAFALFALPQMLLQMMVKGKYKSSFLRKLGFNFPVIEKNGKKLVWIHAVSVGETMAVAALAKKIKNSSEQPIVLVSSGTESGYAIAKKTLSFADHHVYLPFDFSWIIRPLIRKVRPDLIVLCETDWWYNFLRYAKGCGAKVVVANAKISEKSAALYQKFPLFTARLFELIDFFCVQSSHYLKRFEKLGIGEKKLMVTGNIKFDDGHHPCASSALDELRASLAIKKNDLVVVLASTHDQEEEGLLRSVQPLFNRFPSLKVVVVPRHPERFDEVAALIRKMGLSLHRYSSGVASDTGFQVALVDAMGVLRRCYQLASIAIVAGSFTAKVGGHNILEPLYYDVPVLFGPYMFSQPELLELVKSYRAGIQVDSMEKVGGVVAELLDDSSVKSPLIDAGAKLISENRGATDHAYGVIIDFLSEKRN